MWFNCNRKPHPQVLVMAMTLLVAAFLVLLQLPGGVAPSLPWAAALWAFLLVVTLGIQVRTMHDGQTMCGP